MKGTLKMRDRKYANIDSRLLKLLDELCSESNFVTLKELSKRLNLTRRQVEYDVHRLDDIFYYLQLPPLISIENKGIKIEEENIAWFGKIFRHDQERVRFNYKNLERTAFIIVHIIIGGSKYTYEDFCHILGVSRTTIFEDIKLAKAIVTKHDATLNYDVYYNYYINATGENLMNLLKECAGTLFKNIPKELFRYLVDSEVYQQIIKL